MALPHNRTEDPTSLCWPTNRRCKMAAHAGSKSRLWKTNQETLRLKTLSEFPTLNTESLQLE